MQSTVGIFFCNRDNEPEVCPDKAILGILHHLLAEFDFGGMGQDVLRLFFKLVLDILQVLICQLQFTDKVFDRITGKMQFLFYLGTSALGCKVTAKLTQFLCRGNMELVLQLLLLFLERQNLILCIDEVHRKGGDLFRLKLYFCKFLQKHCTGLAQGFIVEYIFPAADHLLFLCNIVLQGPLQIFQLFLVILAITFLVGYQFLIILGIIFFFLALDLGVERFDDLIEKRNHDTAFLDDFLDDQGPVFHFFTQLNFLFGGKQVLFADFAQIQTDRVIP